MIGILLSIVCIIVILMIVNKIWKYYHPSYEYTIKYISYGHKYKFTTINNLGKEILLYKEDHIAFDPLDDAYIYSLDVNSIMSDVLSNGLFFYDHAHNITDIYYDDFDIIPIHRSIKKSIRRSLNDPYLDKTVVIEVKNDTIEYDDIPDGVINEYNKLKENSKEKITNIN